jgi:hypothetical protein
MSWPELLLLTFAQNLMDWSPRLPPAQFSVPVYAGWKKVKPVPTTSSDGSVTALSPSPLRVFVTLMVHNFHLRLLDILLFGRTSMTCVQRLLLLLLPFLLFSLLSPCPACLFLMYPTLPPLLLLTNCWPPSVLCLPVVLPARMAFRTNGTKLSPSSLSPFFFPFSIQFSQGHLHRRPGLALSYRLSLNQIMIFLAWRIGVQSHCPTVTVKSSPAFSPRVLLPSSLIWLLITKLVSSRDDRLLTLP